MYKLLGGLKDYFKLQEVQTDNAVFRLHNVFTTVLLLTCSLVITATQYVGQPISCIVSGIPTHVVNTFCWISSTFTMPDAFNRQVSTLPFISPHHLKTSVINSCVSTQVRGSDVCIFMYLLLIFFSDPKTSNDDFKVYEVYEVIELIVSDFEIQFFFSHSTTPNCHFQFSWSLTLISVCWQTENWTEIEHSSVVVVEAEEVKKNVQILKTCL